MKSKYEMQLCNSEGDLVDLSSWKLLPQLYFYANNLNDEMLQ